MVLTPYPAVNDLITMLGQKSSYMICNPIKKKKKIVSPLIISHIFTLTFYLN